MEPQPELLPLYLELLDAYGRQGQGQLRDAFALLAAEAYLASGQEDEAEALFAEFARRNPGHAVARIASLAAAVHHPEASGHLDRLRETYPEDVVRSLVQEARARRPLLASAAPARQNNPPPNRGPGNPVPRPHPQPTLPPRREPAPAPARPAPQPARPAPAGPGGPTPGTGHAAGRGHVPYPPVPPEPEGGGLPAVNFVLFLALVLVGVFVAAWVLIRPLLR